MSGSKTKYYVSSTTFPLFDRDKVVDQFQSAVIDQTTNSSIELSEYLKNHYRNTELWNFRRFISWCKTSGYNNQLGSIESVFYSNPSISNTLITEAIKHLFTLGEKDTFQVNSNNLNYFNSDYWLRYLATQQGKANLFGSSDENYTVDYPTDTTIRATFDTGEIVEGPLPDFTSGARFLEISWFIDKVTERKIYPKDDTPGTDSKGSTDTDTDAGTGTGTPSAIADTETPSPDLGTDSGTTDPTPEPEPEPEPIIVTDHDYLYGFYMYQEGTGIPVLDVVMAENNIKADYTFYPVVPIRTNTAWLNKTKQDYVGKALKQLSIMSTKTGDNAAYWELANSLTKGMTQGSMDDIDYITLVPGININTRDKASQRYLFEFFYKIYLNSALAHGETPAALSGGRITYKGHNYISSASKKIKKNYADANYTRNFYRSFNVSNPTSNLNLTYDWAGADFYENNGKWKPNAKPGDYGVLAGKYIYRWTTLEPLLDAEGNVVHKGSYESGYTIVYHEVEHSTEFNLTFFCHQESVNRWKAVAFVDLYLRNLVYHGKYVETSAYDAVKDSGKTGAVVQDFSSDFNENGEELDTSLKIFTMEYVENPGDSDSAFIVPLELTTFRDVGVVNQYQLIKLCSYLVYNCWVKKKVKWYQRGFFSVVISALGVAIGSILCIIPCPPLQVLGAVTVTYFATMLAITLTAWAMNVGLKILCAIFGERLGTQIDNFINTYVLAIVVAIVACIPGVGWIIAAGIMFVVTAAKAINAGYGMGMALRMGAKAGVISAAASYAASGASAATQGAIGTATTTVGQFATKVAVGAVGGAVYSGVSALGNSLIDGQGFGSSIKTAFKSALIGGITGGVMAGVSTVMPSFNFGVTSGSSTGTGTAASPGTLTVNSVQNFSVSDLLKQNFTAVLKNPMTYINLINLGLEERTACKLQNLENDYQQFNNQLESANKLLSSLQAQSFKSVTAQETIKMQSCIGRLLTMFPEANELLSWESVRTLALATGSDHCKAVLGAATSFVSSSLSMGGYTPYTCYLEQDDNTISWDND